MMVGVGCPAKLLFKAVNHRQVTKHISEYKHVVVITVSNVPTVNGGAAAIAIFRCHMRGNSGKLRGREGEGSTELGDI